MPSATSCSMSDCERIEVRLDDDADCAAQFGAGVQAANDVESHLRQGRVFHVDADEVAGGLGMFGEARGDVLGQLRVEREAHLGELDADIGSELALGDRVEQAMVDVGGRDAPRLRWRRSRRASRGVTIMPCWLTDSATRRASSISRPATKRELSWLPMRECSQKRRRGRLRESAIKAERRTAIVILPAKSQSLAACWPETLVSHMSGSHVVHRGRSGRVKQY